MSRSINCTVLLACVTMLASCGGDDVVPAIPPDYTYSCNYFIDAEAGDDANDGSSEATAWRSLDFVASYSRDTGFQQGDAVCLKRGQRFIITNGYLGEGSSGGFGNRFIYYGAYGDPSDPRPIVSPAIRIDSVALWQDDVDFLNTNSGVPTEWQDQGGGIWLWPNSHGSWNSSGFWEDGLSLDNASDVSLADGDWRFVKDVGIYYRPGSGSPFNHELYFAKKFSGLLIHKSNSLVISDIAFEYAGVGISGGIFAPGKSDDPKAISEIGIIGCSFSYTTTAIQIRSDSFNGVAYQSNNIAVIGNDMSDLRYAVRLHSSNGSEGFSDIAITGNTVRRVAVDGQYINSTAIDIEAISLQNAVNTVIKDNDLRVGLKESDGFSPNGTLLSSVGIINWRHPNVTLRDVEVTGNFISGMSRGIVLGAGSDPMMERIVVSNNIVTDNEIGIKVNGRHTGSGYTVAYNTLYRNGQNLSLAPLTGQDVIGNLSIEPLEYHVVAIGAGSVSVIDNNGYAPDGAFRIENTADITLSEDLPSLSVWIARYAFTPDANSILAADAGLDSAMPIEPADFRLGAASAFLDVLTESESGIVTDYAGSTRPSGAAADIGAWEQ